MSPWKPQFVRAEGTPEQLGQGRTKSEISECAVPLLGRHASKATKIPEDLRSRRLA